jgi:Na+(H+)/acetate symporter ActP
LAWGLVYCPVIPCLSQFHEGGLLSIRLTGMASTLELIIVPPQTLARLDGVDLLVIAIYFAIVIYVGFHLKGEANTSEDFFMAGREMTAWIAGLSFVSANLGSLELMGWAGSAYQYGILVTHWYWLGAIPPMLFLGMVMMPFYYISKTHSVPGYLHLRYGDGARALSAISFAFMTYTFQELGLRRDLAPFATVAPGGLYQVA